MKTSNKILIILAALFLVVPLTAMVIESTNYKDRATVNEDDLKERKFEDKLENFTAFTPGAFKTISISNSKLVFTVTLIKDKQFGVKVQNRFKNDVKISIGNDGDLKISVAMPEGSRSYISLMIYAPDFSKINLSDLIGFNLNGTGSSLSVTASNVQSLDIDDMKFDTCNITTTGVKNLNVSTGKIGTMTLALNDCNFSSSLTDYNNLSINASGRSEIMFNSRQDEKPVNIENLKLVTTGETNVNADKTNIRNISGSLSDATSVNMSVEHLRKLLKP